MQLLHFTAQFLPLFPLFSLQLISIVLSPQKLSQRARHLYIARAALVSQFMPFVEYYFQIKYPVLLRMITSVPVQFHRHDLHSTGTNVDH